MQNINETIVPCLFYSANCLQGEGADTELSRVLRERDELQAMLLDFEKHMEDIQIKVKLLTNERDKLSTQYQQVTKRILAHYVCTWFFKKMKKDMAWQIFLNNTVSMFNYRMNTVHGIGL